MISLVPTGHYKAYGGIGRPTKVTSVDTLALAQHWTVLPQPLVVSHNVVVFIS